MPSRAEPFAFTPHAVASLGAGGMPVPLGSAATAPCNTSTARALSSTLSIAPLSRNRAAPGRRRARKTSCPGRVPSCARCAAGEGGSGLPRLPCSRAPFPSTIIRFAQSFESPGACTAARGSPRVPQAASNALQREPRRPARQPVGQAQDIRARRLRAVRQHQELQLPQVPGDGRQVRPLRASPPPGTPAQGLIGPSGGYLSERGAGAAARRAAGLGYCPALGHPSPALAARLGASGGQLRPALGGPPRGRVSASCRSPRPPSRPHLSSPTSPAPQVVQLLPLQAVPTEAQGGGDGACGHQRRQHRQR